MVANASRNTVLLAVQVIGIVYVLTFTSLAGAIAKERLQQHIWVAPFERIEVNGAIEIQLHQVSPALAGEGYKVTALGSPASLQALDLESVDGTLYIDATQTSNDVALTLPVARVSEIVNEGPGQISASGLRQMDLVLEGSGSGRFSLEDLHVDQLIVNGAGATEFLLSGNTRLQVVEMIGLSSYDAHALTSETSHIEVRGACSVQVWADELLDVLVYGIARVRYSGDARINQSIMGAGRVDRW